METIKRAIFIAAGEGKRLRPVTLETPKPLVEVNGSRIMDRSIAALRKKGIQDIYIVVGYKKEKFYEVYGNASDIHIIENPYYLQGNNITSMYLAREFLPESFVIEGDLLVNDDSVFDIQIKKSGYVASWMDASQEWSLTLQDGKIVNCNPHGSDEGYRLWGISMWNKVDGERLATEIKNVFESKEWNIFWDEIALMKSIQKYELGIREVKETALCEIDTLKELIEIDSSYKDYLERAWGKQ